VRIRAPLSLMTLFQGRPGLTPSEGGHLAEAAAVAYSSVGLPLPMNLHVSGCDRFTTFLDGPEVTGQMLRTHGDLDDAAEWGACGVAAVLIEATHDLTILEKSPKSGKGFDYFLIPVGHQCTPGNANFFAEATHIMEVSGTRSADEAEMSKRERRKLARLTRNGTVRPALVVIVDFVRCRARVVSRA